MLKESYPYYLASEPHYANTDLDVTNKYTGEVATKVAMADADTIDKAIAAAEEAQPAMAAMAPFERQAVLEQCVKRFTERADEFAQVFRAQRGYRSGYIHPILGCALGQSRHRRLALRRGNAPFGKFFS